MTCKEKILSNDYADLITDYVLAEQLEGPDPVDYCFHRIDSGYGVAYVDRSVLPPVSAGYYGYRLIPKLYGLMRSDPGEDIFPEYTTGYRFDLRNLLEIGSYQLQESPLSLRGTGVIVGIVDTGIQYEADVFRKEDGSSRILSIWDQTIQDGRTPEGFLYGTEYTKKDIDRALNAVNPREIVPSTDADGHGTAMASVAVGSSLNQGLSFCGAAPEADIAVVKVKEAKQYLRDFYLLPDGVKAYQENDIMEAVNYLQGMAIAFSRPVVILIGMGTNLGSHDGTSPLGIYLGTVAARRSRAVVVTGGNEGDKEHHYEGNIPDTVEVRVSQRMRGFCMEIWGSLPDTYSVIIRTPGGENSQVIGFRNGIDKSVSYIFEDTRITASVVLVEENVGEQLIFLRFDNPGQGIWSIRVLADGEQRGNGRFHMWLPTAEFLEAPVAFLEPDPNVTLTEPSNTNRVITVAAYNSENGSRYPASGRGYTRNDIVRPDFALPGVRIQTAVGERSGTEYAAALAAGCVAQFMEWAIVNGNAPAVESRGIKSYMIKGATRETGIEYPDRRWGFGKLNLLGTLEVLARL